MVHADIGSAFCIRKFVAGAQPAWSGLWAMVGFVSRGGRPRTTRRSSRFALPQKKVLHRRTWSARGESSGSTQALLIGVESLGEGLDQAPVRTQVRQKKAEHASPLRPVSTVCLRDRLVAVGCRVLGSASQRPVSSRRACLLSSARMAPVWAARTAPGWTWCQYPRPASRSSRPDPHQCQPASTSSTHVRTTDRSEQQLPTDGGRHIAATSEADAAGREELVANLERTSRVPATRNADVCELSSMVIFTVPWSGSRGSTRRIKLLRSALDRRASRPTPVDAPWCTTGAQGEPRATVVGCETPSQT